MASLEPTFHLLEINLISAQDIAQVSKSMRTYAVAWVNPDRKLTTRVDNDGGTNPTWNDKFVFRVDSKFLESDTSSVMIEIYGTHWFRDIHIGSVRVLVGNLVPPQIRTKNQLGMRFVALQVRRPSGRPQGILNVGVTVLDSTVRSMPLYTLLSSAAGYEKFIGQNDQAANKGPTSNNHPQLRRSSSEKSSLVSGKGDSIVNMPTTSLANNKDIVSIVEANKKGTHKKDEIYDKPLSIVDGDRSDLGLPLRLKAHDVKADSVLSYGSSVRRLRRRPSRKSPSSVASRSNVGSIPPLIKQINKNMGDKTSPTKGYNFEEYPIAKSPAAGSVCSMSEIGPSPSEVAAAIAEDSRYRAQYEEGSSMVEYEQSDERWKREMPNRYGYSPSSDGSSLVFAGGNRHRRRHTDGGDGAATGKFRCFGNFCGYEYTIVCGNNLSPRKKNKGGKRRGSAPSSLASTYF